GNYQYYIEKTEEKAALKAKEELENPTVNDTVIKQNDSYVDQKQQKREQSQIERQIETCELNIETYEEEINNINHQLTLPDVYSDPEKANA
ncbi:ABC transporter ATP-binding protein, partial [Staphylococcus aureus]|nr:ABC transporter ATP-binding protein [Staphylococcus aureus]